MVASQESIAHMQSPWPCPLRVLRRDGRKQREERREKRANGRQLDSLNFYRVPKGREGAEKSRTLEETRDERKEKREDREKGRAQKEERRKDNHNQHERLTKAIVRSHNGEAQDRVDWKRDG